MIKIVTAEAAAPLNDVRLLIGEFVAWHRKTHVADRKLIDRYFDPAALQAELAGLPGHYSSPRGALLAAYHEGQPAGCVAMRDLGDGACEMKRMYVVEQFRGLGIGRALAASIIEAARRAGHRRMLLDTGRHQHDAIRLYESLGFTPIPPYAPVPDAMRDWLVYFEKSLTPAAARSSRAARN